VPPEELLQRRLADHLGAFAGRERVRHRPHPFQVEAPPLDAAHGVVDRRHRASLPRR
jgi:hypothetical protein